jgi:hypothetical protein
MANFVRETEKILWRGRKWAPSKYLRPHLTGTALRWLYCLIMPRFSETSLVDRLIVSVGKKIKLARHFCDRLEGRPRLRKIDSKTVVLKVRRFHLCFHKELPVFLTGKPQYDIARLNRKLLACVGDTLFDSMTSEYDRLYSSILSITHKAKVGGLVLSVMTPDSVETIPFILHTPGMKRHLKEIAAIPESDEPSDFIVRVNGPNFPITGLRSSLREPAHESLQSIERL